MTQVERTVSAAITSRAMAVNPYGPPIPTGRATLHPSGRLMPLHINVPEKGLTRNLDKMLADTDSPFGRVVVEAEQVTYPDGATEQILRAVTTSQVQFTGDPADQVTVTAGLDDWATVVELTGVTLTLA